MSCRPHYLLIMACSQLKRSEAELLPAIERYDGPPFRLLRRFLREQLSVSLDIYILSAEFGLIPSNQAIPSYDHRMTPMRAQELKPHNIAELKRILSTQCYQELYIYMGRDYLLAIDGYDKLIPLELTIKVASGAPGKKLSELRSWLYGKSLIQHPILPTKSAQGRACLRGIEVAMTPTQIFDVARRALAERQDNSTNYQSWYVLVDGQRVAPKWLVSQLTGLSASSFHSGEARRLLQQLGIQVDMV